ncbi:MAG: CinA family protein [Clostridia bacterium]|nr:CinA family protein [Clostridia bacterium]
MGQSFIEDLNAISQRLVSLLINKSLKIATAESCTGGLISQKITDIPGASKIFECGICSYSDNIKRNVLRVNSETLEKYSAVSHQTALEMANNIKYIANADIGISTTGYAGPKQSNPNETVGMVFIGIVYKKFSSTFEFNLTKEIKNLPEDKIRDYIRKKISAEALLLAIKATLDDKI